MVEGKMMDHLSQKGSDVNTGYVFVDSMVRRPPYKAKPKPGPERKEGDTNLYQIDWKRAFWN
jgi:hypothetical protein